MHWPIRVLSVVVCGSALGAAFVAYNHASSVNSLLFIELGWDEGMARCVDVVAAILLILSAALVLLAGAGSSRTRLAACTLIGVWFLGTGIATTIVGGNTYSHLAVPAGAARILAPAGLVMLAGAESYRRGAERLLALGVAVVFGTHGYEALAQNPRFIDLIILSADRWQDWLQISEASARSMLMAIGVIDVLVAGLVLRFRWPALALYLLLWGALTAASRWAALGTEAWPQVALRLANGGIPLVLFLLWRRKPIIQR